MTLAVTLVVAASCAYLNPTSQGTAMSDTKNTQPDFSGSGPVEYNPAPEQSDSALAPILAREENKILAIEGVTSIGIGVAPAGNEVFEVGVIDASVASQVPSEIEGVPVVITITGPVRALPQR